MFLILLTAHLLLFNHFIIAQSLSLNNGHYVYISTIPQQTKAQNRHLNSRIDIFNKMKVGIVLNATLIDSKGEIIISPADVPNNAIANYSLKVRKRYLNLHLIPTDNLPINSFAVIAKMSLNSKPHLCGMTVRIIGEKRMNSNQEWWYSCRVYDYSVKKFIKIQLKANVLWKWPTYNINPTDLLYNQSISIIIHKIRNDKSSIIKTNQELFAAMQIQLFGIKVDDIHLQFKELVQKYDSSVNEQRQINFPFAKKHQRESYMYVEDINSGYILDNYFVIERKDYFYGSVCWVMNQSINKDIPTIINYQIIFYDWNQTDFVEMDMKENELYLFPVIFDIKYPINVSITQYNQLLVAMGLDTSTATMHMLHEYEAFRKYAKQVRVGSITHAEMINLKEIEKIFVIFSDMFQRFGDRMFDIEEHILSTPTLKETHTSLVHHFKTLNLARQYKKNQYVVLGISNLSSENKVSFNGGILFKVDFEEVICYVVDFTRSLISGWMMVGQFSTSLAEATLLNWPTPDSDVRFQRQTSIPDDEKELANSLIAQLMIINTNRARLLNRTKEHFIEVVGVALCQRYGVSLFRNFVVECMRNWNHDKYIYLEHRLELIHGYAHLKEYKKQHAALARFAGKTWIKIIQQATNQTTKFSTPSKLNVTKKLYITVT